MSDLIRTDTAAHQRTPEREAVAHPAPRASRGAQYSLATILGLWALAAVPMGILGWVVSPRLAPATGADPLRVGGTRLLVITLGLVWQFVLALIVVRQEEGDLRWATVRRRLRLNTPRDPATGEPRARLWLWVVPFLVAVTVVQLPLSAPIRSTWVSVFPFFAEHAGYGPGAIFQSPDCLLYTSDAADEL